MDRLRRTGLADTITERIADRRPTLLICLGMQLLCEGSDESPDVAGLGIVPGHVTRFTNRVRVPQLGWNRVASGDDEAWLSPGYAYFANSYKLDRGAEGWQTAYAVHGDRFVAALTRGSILACQFHPELSGAWGLGLIRRWLDNVSEEGARRC
jgi:imidazole glycerol phosphate synthase glutamine amidotransferase subunit